MLLGLWTPERLLFADPHWLKCSASIVQQESYNTGLVRQISQTWHEFLQNPLISVKEGKHHSKEMQLQDQKKRFLQNFDHKTEVWKVMVCGFVKVIEGKEDL